MMLSQIPKWVKELSNANTSKDLLMQLARSSRKPLETPREINFDIRDFNDKEDAEAAAKQIAERGWITHIDLDHARDSKYWVGATKAQYEIVQSSFTEDEAFFRRIAGLYHATYDGWYAMVIK